MINILIFFSAIYKNVCSSGYIEKNTLAKLGG